MNPSANSSVPSEAGARRPSLVIVGAGPRGTGLVERVAANAAELYGGRPLDLHLVDPHPPGGGRVWRPDQSPLLWMNSMAEDVTMFTDDSVRCEGPISPGPSLAEWAGRVRDGDVPAPEDPALAAEIRALRGTDFPTRRLQSAYLNWVYERAAAALPPGIRLRHHRRRAVRLTGPREGRQRVWLEGSAVPLVADLVVLALGHLDAEPDAEQRALARFAAAHGLVHLPPAFTADADLSALRPGEPVLVRGFGLVFVDLMVLLTEGRGGRFVSADGANGADGGRGELVYLPSGREPVLYVGSRRGVPYHSKIGYGWRGAHPTLPRFFGPAQVDELLRRPGQLDFRRDVWPLIAKELGHAHYERLFAAHPERTRGSARDFAERYAALAPGDPGDEPSLAALVEAAVPDPADRFDPAALDRPLADAEYGDAASLQEAVRAYVAADLDRRADPAHSPDLAVFLALLSVYGQLVPLVGSSRIAPRSRIADLDGWWHGFFSYYASGPPAPRLRQLLALSRAGLVRFLGPGMTVEADAEEGVFRARGSAVRGAGSETVARALVEARQPAPSVRRTRDPLLRALHEDGAGGEEVLREDGAALPTGLLAVDPDDGRVLERDGLPHPRRIALGAHTNSRAYAAFARPRTNAPAFRQNDATARAVLTFLRDRCAPHGAAA
ncbi:FAD/NAD(P)-binding protein [Streptomyces daliensis]|uniref:FAD/NAD(P)-binding protein n=1 Tax=Streptomyces daliensis TaxID=299421 RepID=A0A8T4IZC5_9ACTN|nr:FAD/NAD(P)-binding protein [Streptomyces daliensis]